MASRRAVSLALFRNCSRCVTTGFTQADLRKLEYTLRRQASGDPFAWKERLAPTVSEAIEWQVSRTPQEVIDEREEMISAIEFAGSEIFASGKGDHWFADCDEITKRVTEGVNGYLLEELLRASGHCDTAVVDLFRKGALMLGELERSGVGKPLDKDVVGSVATLQAGCAQSNRALLEQLRVDPNADARLEIMKEDARLGRMSAPVPFSTAACSGMLLNPRFGVIKEKEGSEVQVRAVDHLSWSPSTRVGETIERCRVLVCVVRLW